MLRTYYFSAEYQQVTVLCRVCRRTSANHFSQYQEATVDDEAEFEVEAETAEDEQ